MSEIIQRISQAKHVVVIAHLNPDADSLGSASAMYTYLLTLHKKVSFFCASKNINKKLLFLPWSEKIRDTFPVSADLAIALDCGNKSRLGVEFACDLINIDHHYSNERFGEFCLRDSSCISTSQVVYNLFNANKIKINKKMATSLYAGLLDDSDGFISDEVDGTTFALVKELIDSGADYKLCNKFIMKYTSLGAFRLKAIMHKNMILVHDAKIATFCVTNDDMKASGAAGEDCESVLEESLYLPSVEVALLLKQNADFSIKGSLRSKGKVDVSKIASIFGGGGHTNRAGFIIHNATTLEEEKINILKLIYKDV
ncbi:MAG: hypothetical protein AUK54_05250 [Helicobacteraceae bacterium CG2_30_36_10]|nr:MAG: hypothetical protein AUK54_05250 [Helicobacteraceae bacterium CG2_30_36_10]